MKYIALQACDDVTTKWGNFTGKRELVVFLYDLTNRADQNSPEVTHETFYQLTNEIKEL